MKIDYETAIQNWLFDELDRAGSGSKKNLAAKLSIHQNAISNMLSGKRAIKAYELKIMEEYFNSSPFDDDSKSNVVQNISLKNSGEFDEDAVKLALFQPACETVDNYLKTNKVTKKIGPEQRSDMINKVGIRLYQLYKENFIEISNKIK